MSEYITGVVKGYVAPYVRMTRDGRFSNRAKRYHQSQKALRASLMEGLARKQQWRDRILQRPIIDRPIRFGLEVFLPAVKSGPNKGKLPSGGKGGGDYDNYLKAFLDSAKYSGIIKDDSPRWYRGPCYPPPKGLGVWVPGVYLAKENTPYFNWVIEVLEEK